MMDQLLPALLGVLAGMTSSAPLDWALLRAAAGREVDMLIGMACVIGAFVIAQGFLAAAYVIAPGSLAPFGVALVAAFLVAIASLGMACWRRFGGDR